MTSILKVDQIQTTAGAAPTAKDLGFADGSVLQTVYNNYGTMVTVSQNTSHVSTGLTATITPTSTSSKILIIASQQARIFNNTSDNGYGIRFKRDSTVIYTPSATNYHVYTYINNVYFDMRGNNSFYYLDSPASTSALTYSLEARMYQGSGAPSVRYQDNSNQSNIILMEIAQ
tara:strand:+ start:680 stop:1198 length:519 start_codon:yes stop_codon:yes gene_type:complete